MSEGMRQRRAGRDALLVARMVNLEQINGCLMSL